MARRLTEAQTRMLVELAEPNSNPGNVWYFPQKDLRTLRVLAERGFAKVEEVSGHGYGNRHGYSITLRGRQELHNLGIDLVKKHA